MSFITELQRYLTIGYSHKLTEEECTDEAVAMEISRIKGKEGEEIIAD